MKICIITSLYKPYSKGGAERIVESVIDGLIGKGNEVVIITTKPSFVIVQALIKIAKFNYFYLPVCAGMPRSKNSKFSYFKEDKINNTKLLSAVKIVRFYPWNLFWFGDIDKKPFWLRLPWHIIDVFNVQSFFKIKKILKKEKPDVVMTHNLKGIGYTAPMAIRACGIRHIHTLHDVQLVEPSGLLYQKNKKTRPVCAGRKQENKTCLRRQKIRSIFIYLYATLNKKLFGSPDIIVSPSQWLLDFYTNRGFFKNSKKLVIKNPIPATRHFSKGDKEKLFHKENYLLRLLFIGQIEEHKGIIFLINIIKQFQNVHLDIMGGGTKLDEIKKICNDYKNINIHGFIENKSVYKYIVQSDFVVIPSLCAENAPTVIYECFSCGVPCIASNVGGICELVKNGYNGYIFEAGNEESLKNLIQRCLVEKNKWNELRQNSLRLVEGWGIDNYLDLLLEKLRN